MDTTTAPKPVRVRSQKGLTEAVASLGRMKEEQQTLTAERDRRIAEINAEYGPAIQTLDEGITSAMQRIGAYVKKHHNRLFAGGTKHADTEAGRVAIQTGATITKVTDEDAAVAFLKRKRGKLADCLKTKHSLDKNKLKALQAEVPGVEYVSGRERLQVTPANLGTVITDEL
jgi:phage host-nuclease inhibitor protein Gam